MTSSEQYNGWTNRETWALNLWLSNDQGLYELTNERVSEAVAEHQGDTYFPASGTADEQSRYNGRIAGNAVYALWEELTDPNEGLMSCESILEMVRDVGSDYRVNWDEIGKAWLEGLSES